MKKWSLQGFEALRQGSFENAGQNLYVSRKGVLQRIWRFDVNNDGYVDLPVANSHDYNEHPPVYILEDPAGEARRQEVLTQGSQCAVATDVNGDGYDDLIICAMHDGQHCDLASYVYFGGPDGITENRKVDLAAKTGACCGVGDFNGDGILEICYLVADCEEFPAADNPTNIRLRVYRQHETGFRMDAYTDYPAAVSYFTVADIDGDGCDDLYCRTPDGRWLVLWGGPEGFSMENSTEVGPATEDGKWFELLPFGGGNMRYYEFARPKVLRLDGKQYLFYAGEQDTRLIAFDGRKPGEALMIPENRVISAAAGSLTGKGSRDLVLLQARSLQEQVALVYHGENGYTQPVQKLPLTTPRDVLLCDFTGNGHDDIAVAQGRTLTAHTSESLLFTVNTQGLAEPEPRRFETHNCVGVLAGDFKGNGKKSLIFVNHQQSQAYGHIPVYVYLGGEDGYKPENRLEFPGHSAGTILPVDFNDDGWPDIMVMQNSEDQPFLNPPADLYWGGPEGFSLERKTEIYAPLAWGGHCADLNQDGYLDLVVCCGDKICIQYGTADGFDLENMTQLNPVAGEPEGARSSVLWPALADLNGNGWLDLVVPISYQGYSRIYWGGPEGYSEARSTQLPVDYAATVRVADLNKDGYPDLIFGSRASFFRNYYHEGAVTIFWGGPNGYSGYDCCVLPCYEVGDLSVADLNGDGWLDIFASTYFNKRERDVNSFIYWNDHGNFSLTNRKRIWAHSSSGCFAGDFNEDGYVDLFVTNHRTYGNHRGESAIWWNGPDGFQEENRTWLPTIGPHDMTPNDIGNVMTRGPEEYYITPAATVDGLQSVGWEAEIPAKTWVNCQIRTAETAEALAAAPFIGADGTADSRFGCGQPIPAELVRGKYLQIKLFLGAVNSGNSPRVTEIYAL